MTLDTNTMVTLLQEHEKRLFHVFLTTQQQPVIKYTDKEGNLDRELVSQQLLLRNTLLLSLSSSLSRLQTTLFALGMGNVSIDYQRFLDELTATTAAFEKGMIKVVELATGKSPAAAE